MNLLERTIAVFAPRTAWARAQARQALTIMARFEGARPTKTYKVSRDNTTGERQTSRDAATCRAQARDFERNNDVFRGALHTLSRSIVGPTGISIEPTPRLANDDISDDFARQLLNAWREFTESPEVTGTLDWVQVQDLVCRSWLRDGDVFAQFVEGFSAPFSFATRVPLALELLEADHVPLDYSPSDTIEAGIERNAWNQPTAYYVWKQHPGGMRLMATADALKRVSADRMLHVAIRDRLSGLRGVSQFASVLTRLHDLKDYEDSERLAARISAAIAAYVKRDPNMEWTPPEGFDPTAKRNFRLQAGAIFDQMLPGEELEMLNPNRPNTGMNDFRKGQLMAGSRGAQLTYSAMSGDYRGTYSSQRQELVEGYDGYRTLTAVMVSRFVRPVWQRFVPLAIAAGVVKVPKGVRPETFAQAEFRGPKLPWIDPLKEASAIQTITRCGVQSLQSVIAERGGRLQDTFEQIARERRLARELEIVLESDASVPLTGGAPADPNAPEESDDASTKQSALAQVIAMHTHLRNRATGARAAARTDRPVIVPLMQLKPAAAANEYDLLIYGDIGESWWGESVTALSVVTQLIALDAGITAINVRINSYGGSVADGLAIYNALKRHKATKNVTVDGVAMSIASLIAMAGDTVKMPATSLLMIHAPWGGVAGNAQELRQYAEVLDTYAEAMADAYVAKSGKERADVLKLLQDGADHYYTGDEAVTEGFADKIADPAAGDEPDENARAFASQLIQRYGATLGSRAQLAITAALRVRLPATATEPTNSPAPAGDPAPAPAGNPTGAPVMTEEEKKALREKQAAERAAILAADKTRREAIAAHFAQFAKRNDPALAKLQKECEDDNECTPEAAGLKLLAALGKTTEPLNSVRVEPGAQQETLSFREGAVTAMLHRRDPSAHKLDEKARGFRGFTLVDLARDCVARAGIDTRGMARNEIAVKALQTTSDFPNILENIITKTLRQGYQGSSRTFTAWARQATLPDFKQISRVQIAGAPSLKKVLEGAEYEYGSIGDGAEKYQLFKYGRRIAITWETIINDDLDAIMRVPQAFGGSAADLESDLVYAVLTGNANMSDGVALFHASHGNLGTPAALADALDPTQPNPIAEMRKMMLLQKGLEGRYITVRPKFLIVPPDLEEVALKVTNATILATKSLDLNVVGPSLTPVVEPRLHDSSTTTWYGAADNATVDTVEYAYLEGNEGVFTETRNGFEVDGVEVKCRHVVGTKAIDWRGLSKNAGA